MRRIRVGKGVFVTTVLFLLAASCSALAYRHVKLNDNSARQAGTVKYPAPTAQDKAYNDSHKKTLTQQYEEGQTTQPAAGLQQVTPVITNASFAGQQVTVDAYVGGIFENGGICTVTFSKDGAQFSKQVTAFENATTTNCPPVIVDRSAFSTGGNWQVTVSYNSAKASGISQPEVVILQ